MQPANVKQVLTIILAVLIFHLTLNPTNIFGITLTLAGGAWYARVELQEKKKSFSERPSDLLNSNVGLTSISNGNSPNLGSLQGGRGVMGSAEEKRGLL